MHTGEDGKSSSSYEDEKFGGSGHQLMKGCGYGCRLLGATVDRNA